MDTVISFVTGLHTEAVFVLMAHVLTWLYYIEKVWNTSGMPRSELFDIRQRFSSPNIILKPLVLAANTLWRRLFREAFLIFCLLALASNYFHSHKSWEVAISLLVFVIVALEAFRRFNYRRYRQDLNFCDQGLRTLLWSVPLAPR